LLWFSGQSAVSQAGSFTAIAVYGESGGASQGVFAQNNKPGKVITGS
jgi:hypothetical protein